MTQWSVFGLDSMVGKGRMEDWFVGHKGEVVKGRPNMVEGRFMLGEVLIAWSW